MKKILLFMLLSGFAFGQSSVKDTILSESKATIFAFGNKKVYLGNPANLKFSKIKENSFGATGNNINFLVTYYPETKEPSREKQTAMLKVSKCDKAEITCSIAFDKVDNYTYFNRTNVTKDLALNDYYVVYLKGGGSIEIGFNTSVPAEYEDKKFELTNSFYSLIKEGLIIRE